MPAHERSAVGRRLGLQLFLPLSDQALHLCDVHSQLGWHLQLQSRCCGYTTVLAKEPGRALDELRFRLATLDGEITPLAVAASRLRNEAWEGVSCGSGSAFADTCDPTTGTAIEVTAGSDTAGVDFALETILVFTDGFESGDTSAWSSTTP